MPEWPAPTSREVWDSAVLGVCDASKVTGFGLKLLKGVLRGSVYGLLLGVLKGLGGF